MIGYAVPFLTVILGAWAADYYITSPGPGKSQLWLGSWESVGDGENMDAVVISHGISDVFMGNPLTNITLTKCPCSLDGFMIERACVNAKTNFKTTNIQAFRLGEQFVSWWPVFNSDLRVLYLESGSQLDVFYEIIAHNNQVGLRRSRNCTHLQMTYTTNGVTGAQFFKRVAGTV
ncbi:hypothetical protein BV898_09421 [Hypsibius exemplaris]|uniref:Uncharacterized protein n=1 Tax=Hypsibius exemplaris TaxID=2072580 RepID=A0A1W0WMI5_HYPEX|nr:hypothetical protein BV898_09421 [Hypsibius exemplaris]